MNPLYVYEEFFDRPLVLAGKRAFIVLSRSGEISVAWHRWGPKTDYGGFYAPPQRVTGPIRTGIMGEETLVSLGSKIVRGEYFPGYAIFHYDTEVFSLKKTIFVPERSAGSAIVFTIENKKREETVLPLTLLTESWLSNIDFDGILPEKITFHKTNDEIVMSGGGLHGAISSNIPFDMVAIGGDNISPPQLKATPASFKDRTRSVLVSLDIPFKEREEKTLVVALGASSERKDEALEVVRDILNDWSKLLEEKRAHYEKFLSSVVRIETPDKRLNLAFKSASVALEALKAEHPKGIVGVYAGFPWFAGFWGRDTGWILPALLAIGDFDWTRRTLDSFLRYQANHDYSILDASKGEIPMLHGHKTTFFYGSADSTLYYPILIQDYVFKTGDLKYAERVWPNIAEMIDWGLRKDTDSDGLIENSSSSLEYFVDATWMDTEDRRMKAIEIESLWARALESSSELAALLGKMKESREWLGKARRVKEKMSQMYWNRNEGYFHDTIRPDVKPDSKIRPNAMVALMYEHVPNQQAQQALARIEQGDMTTDWGVRTLSSEDPNYSPEVYHSGVVWPLVTGWTAFAEYSYNRPGKGFMYLKSMARRILEEGGMYAEAYRGDKPIPHISCILQAWSVSTFLWSTIEGLFGIKANALKHEVIIHPQFPKDWEWAEVKNIHVGKARINLHFDLVRKETKAENLGEGTAIIRLDGEVIESNADDGKREGR